MKTIIQLFSFIIGIIILSSCQTSQSPSLNQYPLLPLPQQITLEDGHLDLRLLQSISSPDALLDVKESLVGFWANHYQKELQQKNKGGDIDLVLDPDIAGREAYKISISLSGIKIHAASAEGFYRSWQTLQQLLIFSKKEGQLALGQISDQAAYTYRAVMLDVARHFFSVSEVKRLIDLLALFKFNHLHLHLSDDQGWRIDIASWPNLTAIGGQSEVGGTPGGYYTQKDYQELVAYAAAKYITIVPEIDMPGHTNAALHAYPELNCNGKAPEVHTGIEVGFSSLCIDKPITYQFVDDVIRELAAITPGPYIHIGGDETMATPDKQFIAFIDSILPKVKRYGKIPMGWFETRRTHYPDEMVNQYWAQTGNEPTEVKSGNPIVMSPSSYAYLDMQYDSLSRHGLHWAGYINAKKAYEWNPKNLVPTLPSEDIIGIEAPLWSETITNAQEMDYLLFPRLLGYAEVGWTSDSLRQWEHFRSRAQKQLDWLKESHEIKPYHSPYYQSN